MSISESLSEREYLPVYDYKDGLQRSTKYQDEIDWAVAPIHDGVKTQSLMRTIFVGALLFITIGGFIYNPHVAYAVTFTLWGMYATIFTFILLIIHTMRKEEALERSHTFLSNLWVIMFTLSLVWEIIITIVFWSLLYHEFHPFSSFGAFWNHGFHILPVLFLLIDYFTNEWRLQHKHIWISLSASFVYAVFNAALVLISGRVIYPILTWKDWQSYVYIIGMIIALFIFHHFFVWLSYKKLRESNRNDDYNCENKT